MARREHVARESLTSRHWKDWLEFEWVNTEVE